MAHKLKIGQKVKTTGNPCVDAAADIEAGVAGVVLEHFAVMGAPGYYKVLFEGATWYLEATNLEAVKEQ